MNKVVVIGMAMLVLAITACGGNNPEEQKERLTQLETDSSKAYREDGDTEKALRLARDALKLAAKMRQAGLVDEDEVAELENKVELYTSIIAAGPEEGAKLKALEAYNRSASSKNDTAVLEGDYMVSQRKVDRSTTIAIIRGYVGSGGDITIPSTIQNLPVREVYMNPLKNQQVTFEYEHFDPESNTMKAESETLEANTTITSVVIPDGVEKIGGFTGCTALRSVTIPDSVDRIDNFAFQGCTSLSSVSIPRRVRAIPIAAFQYCTSLASVDIKHLEYGIEDSAFEDCVSLASFPIQQGSLRSCSGIGNRAFRGCASLTSVYITRTIRWIGDLAFADCTSLETVDIKPYKGDADDERVGRGYKDWVGYGFANCPRLSPESREAIRADGYEDSF
ncbi:MAG: leucine-rich repeat domain-containing protein [Treponema sp.]|jgi:hypothetical protein|nr:leucine-rich repeat domain-containing protein [Treponema sp.]